MREHRINTTIRYLDNIYTITLHDMSNSRKNVYNFKLSNNCGNYIEIVIGLNVQELFTEEYKSHARVENIHYTRECSIEQLIKNNIEVIDMIKLSLEYINTIFPVITKLKLNDNIIISQDNNISTLSLSNNYGIDDLSFSLIHILLYGETWYKRHLDAEWYSPPYQEVSKKVYNDYINSINRLNNVIDIDIEYLTIFTKNTAQVELLRPYYDDNKSWHWFFNKIIDNNKCELLYNWIRLFMNFHLDFTHLDRFEIDITKIDKIVYTVIASNIVDELQGASDSV